MKTMLLLTSVVFLIGIAFMLNSAHAHPFISPEYSYENAKHVVIGKVLSVEILSEPYVQKSDNIYSERFGFALYTIQVDDYLKNPLNNSTMKLLGKYTNQRQTRSYETYPYEINQRVLLYIQEIHNIPGYELIISAANSRVIPEEFSSEDVMSRFEYNMSPLKQIQSGISFDEIQCKQNLVLIQKYDGSSACVNRETIPKLFERGWMTGVIEDKWTASYVSPDQAFKHIQNFIFNSDIILDFPKASMMKRISPIPVRITGDTTSQICAELKMECPTGHSFDAAYDLNSQIAAFEQSVGLHIYDVKISNSRICHTVDGDTQSYCTKLDVPYNPIFDGNKTTLLSKTIEQWKDMSDEELYYFYEVYGDEFYTELGKIILKNEIKNMLNLENIVNADDDFTVYVTGIDQSLPPDVYMHTIVNGTDGKRYQFDGGTNTNQILNLSSEKISD